MLSILDALRRAGSSPLDSQFPHQVACPVHGEDRHHSMRVYPQQNNAFCWVCRRSYDPIAIIAHTNQVSYAEARADILSEYGYIEKRPRAAKRYFEGLVITCLKRPALRPRVLDALTRLSQGGTVDTEKEWMEASLYSDIMS